MRTRGSHPCYLAFDLGASSGRAVVGRWTGAAMEMEEVHRFDTPVQEEDGHLYWNLDALWKELRRGLQQALAAAPRLKSLSVDSWAVDYVPLGADGEVLRAPFCYRDTRTDGQMEDAFRRVPKDALYQITGIQFLPFNTLYQVLADQAHDPESHRQTRCHVPIADYFNSRFGGRRVVDQSMASTTQLMDVQRFAWAEELMDAFGIAQEAWPEIVPGGTCLGPVDADQSQTPDLQSEIEVVASLSHDTACAVAAVPAEASAPWAYLSSGTWSLLGTERRQPILTDAACRAGFANEVGLDGTIRFLKNLTGLWPLQECVRAWRAEGKAVDYDTLMDEAAKAPPGLARIDLDDERFQARGDMEGRLKDYCRSHGQPVPQTRGQLTRVLLESLAQSYRRALHTLETLTHARIGVLHVVGGGSRNSLLCQLTADACGRRVVAGPAEATALGNLLVQARTMGDLPEGLSVRAAARQSSALTTYHPETQTA